MESLSGEFLSENAFIRLRKGLALTDHQRETIRQIMHRFTFLATTKLLAAKNSNEKRMHLLELQRRLLRTLDQEAAAEYKKASEFDPSLFEWIRETFWNDQWLPNYIEFELGRPDFVHKYITYLNSCGKTL